MGSPRGAGPWVGGHMGALGVVLPAQCMSCLVRPNNCELWFQGCHVTLWDCSSRACALNIPCPQPGRLSAQLLLTEHLVCLNGCQ